MNTLMWSGARLKMARLKKDWSQDDLARAVQTGVRNIGRYERNKHTPNARMTQTLAAALGVETDEFFEDASGDDDEEADPVLLALREALPIERADDLYLALKPRLREPERVA